MKQGGIFVIVAALAAVSPAQGQTLTTELVADGVYDPTWAGAPPGDTRIFVTERSSGEVHLFDGTPFSSSIFLDLGALLTQGGDQGLLSMAFHPKFAQNRLFFVHYNAPDPNRTVIACYEVSASDPDVADPSSARVVLEIDQPGVNHNGGSIAFSPVDGYLYFPTGDGGSQHDPECHGQNPLSLLGKILRIDVDHVAPGLGYSIPADNPFAGSGTHAEEIWALGLRNPWRSAFDPLTGDLYIGDVGQWTYEEVIFEPALAGGRNYGWPVMEGTSCHTEGVTNCQNQALGPPPCFDPIYTPPATTLNTGSDGCSVIGGVVYRGCKMPDLQGTYFFADYCSGRYWSMKMVGGAVTELQERTTELVGAGTTPSSFGVDGQGEILVTRLSSNGYVSRIVPTSSAIAADCDGNGLDDDCEVATYDHADTDASGTLDACETMSVDTAAICVGLDGEQRMSLHAGAAQGGEFYLVLGTLAGTVPGVPIGPSGVPLNIDSYTLYSLTHPNTLPLVSSLGTLDGSGEASASFRALANTLPAVALGLTAHHAFVLIDLATNDVTFASNATSLTFVP